MMIVILRGHLTTDPACLYHRPPRRWWSKQRYDRARGRSCDLCMKARAHFHTESGGSENG